MKKLMLLVLVAVLAAAQMGCPQDQRRYSVTAQIHDSTGSPVGSPVPILPDVLRNIEGDSDPGPVHFSFERIRSGEFIRLREVNVLYRLPSGEQVFVDLLNREKVSEGEKSLEAAAIAFLVVGGAYGVAGEFVVTTGLEILRLDQLTRFTVRVPFGSAVESAQVSVKFDFVDARDRVRESANFNRRIIAAPSAPPQTEFEVPQVEGQQEHQATTTLQNAGFTVGTVDTVCSDTVEYGRVISTSPAAGAIRGLGTAINLVVSNGQRCTPQTGTVPSVVGQFEWQASNSLQNAGFTLGTVTHECSDTVGQDRVIRTSPASGTTRNLGTAVNIVVSSGSCVPTTGTVPNVVGQTQAVASTTIVNAGFTVGTITTTCSDTVPKGQVISQSPAAGASRNLGTAVSIVVSTGSCPVADLEVSFKVRNQQGQFVSLPNALVVPLGQSRVFELAINGGKPDYLVTLLDYDGHGIQFRVWQKGKEEVLVDETHFVLSPDQLFEFDMAEDKAGTLDEIFMLKGVEVLNRVGATLSVDWVGPNATVRITKDFTATTQIAQPAYLFVSDSSEPVKEVELTWKVQVE